MARQIRVEYPGASYHVINRGNRQERVFLSDADYTLFLDKLAEYADLYDVVIYSYCLLPNHCHLFLKTRHANLGKFMQSFNTSFTLSMNNKYDKNGHLFQGRYKAQLVETELYKNKLSRYIHLNPVKLTSLKNRPLLDLKKILCEYKWSSFCAYLGIVKKPDWLDRSFVLSSWGKTSNEKNRNYRKYVEEGLLSDNTEGLTPNEISNIIGSDYFTDKIIRKYLTKRKEDIDEREQPELVRINSFSVEDIIRTVAMYFNLEGEDKIAKRKGSNQYARKIAMYLAVKNCKKTNSLARIASYFGIGINGISSNTKKCLGESINNKLFIRQLDGINKLLHENTKTKV